MNELEKLLARMAELETVAERSAKEEKELKKAQTRVAELEKERDGEADKTAKRLAEMERKEAIRDAGDQYKVDTETVRAFVKDETKTLQDFKDALLESRISEAPLIPANVLSQDGKQDMMRAIEDAFVIRLGGDVKDPHKDLDKFRGASLLDIVRAMNPDVGYSKDALVERALGTADLPNLLISSGNRFLVSEFEAAMPTYSIFAEAMDVSDFRSNSDITAGSGGRLAKINEHGELKERNLGESAESWNLETYGGKYTLTRKALINDDLGAFTKMLSDFIEDAVLTANAITYDLLMKRGDYASYTMSDGTAIFHADHSNLGSSALSATTLAAGRAAMRKHKGIDGVTALNIVPKYLLVGPDLEQTAYELVNSIAKVEDNKSSGVANYHQNALEVIVDAEITGSQWFLSAARRAIKVGYLSGTGRRPVLKMNDSTLTQTVFEGVFDIGVVASDYRGLYAGNGVA